MDLLSGPTHRPRDERIAMQRMHNTKTSTPSRPFWLPPIPKAGAQSSMALPATDQTDGDRRTADITMRHVATGSIVHH